VASPKGCEVEFPYGSFDATIPGLSEDEQPNIKKRKENPVKPKGAKKFKISLLDKKFSSTHLNDLRKSCKSPQAYEIKILA
jgi:hypothetical protein